MGPAISGECIRISVTLILASGIFVISGTGLAIIHISGSRPFGKLIPIRLLMVGWLDRMFGSVCPFANDVVAITTNMW